MEDSTQPTGRELVDRSALKGGDLNRLRLVKNVIQLRLSLSWIGYKGNSLLRPWVYAVGLQPLACPDFRHRHLFRHSGTDIPTPAP